MLVDRIKVLKSYTRQVQAGNASTDHRMLRQITALAEQLPLVDADAFRAELVTVSSRRDPAEQQEFSDVQLATYMGSTLKQLDALVEVRPALNELT